MKEKEEKEKDREKEREKGREKEKDREKNRDKEKEKLKAKEKDRDSEKKKDRGKEPEKEGRIKEHDRDRGKEQEREKEREKERVKDSDREREKERDRAVDKEKKKEKDRSKKDKGDREKEKERDREKDKAGEQEKLGVANREKEREKHGEREKLGDRDKDKERDNVGDKEKEREKAGEREKERDRERDREREREKEKEREREEKERQKSRLKEKERGREHERERDVRDRDREHEREREGRDRDREHDRERDGRDREREHDRDREGRDREREHEREKGRDREERDRDRQKERDFEADGRDRKRDDMAFRESASAQTSAAPLEERITKMREERLKANAEQKAAAKRTDDEDDIKSWVKKSRVLEHQKKREEIQKAARMAKILSEQDVGEEDDESDDEARNSGYGGKDLAGLKIRHGLDKVMEGGAVVLTLKDSNVLQGDDVNEATDELENIEMAQQIAREDAYKAAKKKTGVYEDKFNNDINAAPRTILPQYDDIVKDEGVVLDESGGINEESKRKLEEARRRLEIVSSKESLVSSLNVASDFFTQEDMLQFKKPKKKKKLRKKDKLDLDELEAEALAAGLGKEDLGSRNSEGRKEKKEIDKKAEAEARKHAYDVALRKGEEASRMLREESTAQAMEVDEADAPVFGAEEDDDLYKSLEKARLAALKKQREAAGPQSIATRVIALSQQSAESSQAASGADTDGDRLVFTDTGEFCRSLQLDDVNIRRAGAKDKDAFGEEEEEAPPVPMEEEESKATGGWTEVSEADKTQPVTAEEEDSVPVEEPPIKEVAVGKGLAGALMLLKERGTLKETVDWGGRNMDKKRSKLVGIVDESNNEVGQRDILLDRVDEFGRTMTPKEAFRKLSHKFHGKGPGKMKQEKRMKQWQEELRLKQMNSGDTPLMSMEKMREAQAKMHTPYIVISGHIKPGQTSDPRSGFATVEKEPIGSLTPMLGDKVGSLTPMLGDKKVEHFLGIKRKPEPGSMGPPPPKQPKGDRH